MNILSNYKKICDEIAFTAMKCGRKISEVTLVAVTKNIPWKDILPIYEKGCREFGESRLHEALEKQTESPEDVNWHFIGTLQKNKIRKAIERFVLIHSVDTPDLAQKISECSIEKGITTKVLLEVNTSGEHSKHGLSVDEWERSFETVISLKGISIEGLMTMAPYTEEEAIIRNCFVKLRELREKLRLSLPEPNKFLHLSMGMSHDFKIAIEEGATLLRIGTALFS